MIAFLITLLMAQGIPALPGQSGTVSGVVRTSAGTPAAGVRVSAMVPPEAGTEAALAGSSPPWLKRRTGLYRLEGIPQGRYYTLRTRGFRLLSGTADTAGSNLPLHRAVRFRNRFRCDGYQRPFCFAFDSFGLISQVANNPSFAVKVNVVVEGGAKLPVFGSGAFTGIRFTDVTTGSQRTQLLNNSFSVSLTLSGSTPEYRVRIENLPEGYIVKSMTYGTTDVLAHSLKGPSALIPRSQFRPRTV